MVEKNAQITSDVLVSIHNSLIRLHPTGEDIIAVASIIMDIRRTLEKEDENADS